MKKKLVLSLVCVAIVAASLLALVACGPSHPADFIKALSEAKDWTMTTFDEEGKIITVMSINSKGEFNFNNEAFAKVSGDKVTIYANLQGDTWGKAEVKKDNANYVNILKRFKMDLGVSSDIDKDNFKQKDGYWYMAVGGEIMEAVGGYKVGGNKMSIYISEGDKMIKRVEYDLKANLTMPKEASSAKVVDADELFAVI